MPGSILSIQYTHVPAPYETGKLVCSCVSSGMQRRRAQTEAPRAIIHKQILDMAGTRPDAPIQSIADDISGASPGLVERVLDEYGDPAREQNGQNDVQEKQGMDDQTNNRTDEHPTTESFHKPDQREFTEKQLKTLREIHYRPEATQREIGDALDVSASTVSSRLSNIEGFDWANRQTVVEDLLEETQAMTNGKGQIEQRDLAELYGRLTDLEKAIAELAESEPSVLPPELTHKVIRACMDSEVFSEAEELELIQAVIGAP